MEVNILASIERVQQCRRHTDQARKVADTSWVRIEAAQAAKPRPQMTKPSVTFAEPHRTAAGAAEAAKECELDITGNIHASHLLALVSKLGIPG
jgi:hypothetical protein